MKVKITHVATEMEVSLDDWDPDQLKRRPDGQWEITEIADLFADYLTVGDEEYLLEDVLSNTNFLRLERVSCDYE